LSANSLLKIRFSR